MSMLQNREDIEHDFPLCPHCSKPLVVLRYGVPFGPLAVKIIDAVLQAGERGITKHDLFDATYRDRAGGSLSRLESYVRTINAALAKRGVAIRNIDQQRYRVMARRA